MYQFKFSNTPNFILSFLFIFLHFKSLKHSENIENLKMRRNTLQKFTGNENTFISCLLLQENNMSFKLYVVYFMSI